MNNYKEIVEKLRRPNFAQKVRDEAANAIEQLARECGAEVSGMCKFRIKGFES